MAEDRYSIQIELVFMQDERAAASFPFLEDLKILLYKSAISFFYVIKSHFAGHLAVSDYSCSHQHTSWGFHIKQLWGLSHSTNGKLESML